MLARGIRQKGLTGKEAVELDKHLEVDIVALGSLAVRVPHVVTVEIDTCLPKNVLVSLMIWYAQLAQQAGRAGIVQKPSTSIAMRQVKGRLQQDSLPVQKAVIAMVRRKDITKMPVHSHTKALEEDASRTHLEG